jgi:hypothetical protein
MQFLHRKGSRKIYSFELITAIDSVIPWLNSFTAFLIKAGQNL